MSAEPLPDQARTDVQGHGHGHAHGHHHPGHHSGHASHAHTAAPSVAAEPIDLTAGTPSLLMRSAGARVAGALVMICVLWLAVGWALMERTP